MDVPIFKDRASRRMSRSLAHPALFSRPFSGMMIGPPGDGEPAKLAGRLVLGGPNCGKRKPCTPSSTG